MTTLNFGPTMFAIRGCTKTITHPKGGVGVSRGCENSENWGGGRPMWDITLFIKNNEKCHEISKKTHFL